MAIKASSTITLIRVDDGDNGIIIQASAPANPYAGQLWQTASGAPVKRWNGSQWVLWYLDVTNLNVENLSAISSTLGTVVNPYDVIYEGEHLKGEIAISDSLVKNEYNVVDTGQKGYWQLTPLSYSMQVDDGHGNLVAGIELSAGSLLLYTNEYNKWLSLSAEMLYDTGWVKQTVLVGTGNIYARRWMGRKMIRFENYVWNNAYQDVIVLTGKFLPTYASTYTAPIWTNAGLGELFTFNLSGGVFKTTNVSGNTAFNCIVEYY